MSLQGKDPFILGRNEAYIGVLIDDLVTKGKREQYRMFTSRAEYRLLLREDNADIRLTKYGHELGLIDEAHFQKINKKKDDINEAIAFLKENSVTPNKEFLAALDSIGEEKINDKTQWIDVIGRGEFTKEKLVTLLPQFEKYDYEAIEQVLIESKYSRYIEKQLSQIDKMEEMLRIKIPISFDYRRVHGLSNEIVEKLEKFTPPTLQAASQISGITPAAIEIIHIYIKMEQKSRKN